MSYLLDTCTVSELVRPRPDRGVVAFVDDQAEEALHLSVLTLGEIQKGIAKFAEGARRVRLQSWLDQDLIQRFRTRVLPVDWPVARAWGTLQGEAERRGEVLPIMDSLIAATATVHQLVVVTRNVADLERCNVPVLDPWQGE